MQWPWPFELQFMQLALASGVIVGACTPLIGTFLVQRRLSLLGDGLGHVAFAGVAGGLLLDVWPVWSALALTVVAAIALERVRARGTASGDLALALFFYGGIAGGVVLMGLSESFNANILSYLFGAILTVSAGDLAMIALLGATIVGVVILTGRALFAIALDEEAARVAGLPVGVLNTVLAVLTAITVVVAMRVVGILLVASLMVLPVGASQAIARSFKGTMIGASGVGVVAVVAGLTLARAFGLHPGGTIVLITALAFGATSIVTGRRSGRMRIFGERTDHDGHRH